jgi:nucleoside-diphosphate-sugar epimerase
MRDVGRSISSRYKKILVVGASGFLGTRLVERLSLGLNLNVRGAVHRPDKAVRLARLPVELFDCDLLERSQVMEAVKGCDVVVNCAIGRRDSSGNAKTEKAVYIRGMRNLLEAAKEQGVRKFIQISTAAVYGFKHKGSTVDESCPLKSRFTRNRYERGKIAQDELVSRFAESIPIVTLRPTLIYGPYSEYWTVAILERLMNNQVTLVENEGLANLVFVDDVVDAILLAIENEEANGKVLIVNNDEETVTWKDYISQFTTIINIAPKILPLADLSGFRLKRIELILRDSLIAVRDNLISSEMAIMLARIPVLYLLAFKLLRGQRRKRIENRLYLPEEHPSLSVRETMREYGIKYEAIPNDFLENLLCHTTFSASVAKSALGWKPRTSFVEGSERTLEWVKWARPSQQ